MLAEVSLTSEVSLLFSVLVIAFRTAGWRLGSLAWPSRLSALAPSVCLLFLFSGPHGITRCLLWDWPSSRSDGLQLGPWPCGAYINPFLLPCCCPALELVQLMLLLPLVLDASPPLPTPTSPCLLTSYSSFKAWLRYHFCEAFSIEPSLCDSLLCLGSHKCVFVFHYNLCSSLLCSLVHSFQI